MVEWLGRRTCNPEIQLEDPLWPFAGVLQGKRALIKDN